MLVIISCHYKIINRNQYLALLSTDEKEKILK